MELVFRKDSVFDRIIFQFFEEKKYNIRKYVCTSGNKKYITNGNDIWN